MLAFGTDHDHRPLYVSIIIDDLGDNYHRGLQIINLPEAVTLSILPGSSFARRLAEAAHRNSKEVMLHLPMESLNHHRHPDSTLKIDMEKEEFMDELRDMLTAVPHIRGFNNHMGSLLTQQPDHMRWLMEEVAANDSLYFVDSRTTEKSVAASTAQAHNIPTLIRDVFLDPDKSPETLERQFDKMIDVARRHGFALALGHPRPETLHFLEQRLGELREHGIELVTVSELIRLQEDTSNVTCTGSACTGL